MINPKEFQIQEIAAASSGGSNSTASESSSSSSDNVLSNLFRARMQSTPRAAMNHHDGNDKPQQRVAPLVSSMAGPSLFQVDSSLPPKAAFHSSGHLPATSLFHQLGQNKRFQSNNSVVNNNSNVPFPLHSDLFATTGAFSMSSTNTRPNQSGQEELDHSLRSLSAALMISRHATASMTAAPSTTPTLATPSNMMMMRNQTGNKKRPLRNQATRMRLVGQVLGQKGLQKLLAVIKELKKVPQSTPSILVDAWEQTPLNDLKTLPWEDMLRDAQLSLEASQK